MVIGGDHATVFGLLALCVYHGNLRFVGWNGHGCYTLFLAARRNVAFGCKWRLQRFWVRDCRSNVAFGCKRWLQCILNMRVSVEEACAAFAAH